MIGTGAASVELRSGATLPTNFACVLADAASATPDRIAVVGAVGKLRLPGSPSGPPRSPRPSATPVCTGATGSRSSCREGSMRARVFRHPRAPGRRRGRQRITQAPPDRAHPASLGCSGGAAHARDAAAARTTARDVCGDARCRAVGIGPRAGLTAAAHGPDVAQIIYTSGSTGLPKGVTLSHTNLWAGMQAVTSYLGITCDDRIASLLPSASTTG